MCHILLHKNLRLKQTLNLYVIKEKSNDTRTSNYLTDMYITYIHIQCIYDSFFLWYLCPAHTENNSLVHIETLFLGHASTDQCQSFYVHF